MLLIHLRMDWQKLNYVFKIKKYLYCEAGHASLACRPGNEKTEMSVYKVNIWKLVDLNWNAVIHQDSKTSPKWETIWITLLSDPCVVHHSANSYIYELAKMHLTVQSETKLSAL